MKRVKMIVTSVAVLAIVGSMFAFNAKKIGKFCVTTSGGSGSCLILEGSKRTTGSGTTYKYVVDWDGGVCNNNSGCTNISTFTLD
jgi:hypothetical protein